ncbi:MAG: hypothetical protein PHV68_05940 [Candidatus Gastranaerophilales bacterium]|nr:hypothetical protein [Candidatus Gastranaerophilales bacterium]
MVKKCPFNKEDCTAECAMYIAPDDLNETVKNKLVSLGVLISRNEGICSLKNIALSLDRHMFENTSVGTFMK